MSEKKQTKLQSALKHLQRRAGVTLAQKVTHEDMSQWAGVSKRTMDEWMRGSVAPLGMTAILDMLSKLSAEDVVAILNEWGSK